MRKLALLVAVLCTGEALAQARNCTRDPGERRQSARNLCTSGLAFEFANGSGVGMGSACAGTAVTGTKGETVTFTRASSEGSLVSSFSPGVPPASTVITIGDFNTTSQANSLISKVCADTTTLGCR